MKDALDSKTETTLLKEARDGSVIVIGAPHHAPGGVKELPCPEHKVSDENTGYIASGIAELLNAHTIIVCLPIVDPNKSLTTEYSKQIIEWKPKYLIEIHGHGGVKAKPNTVEVSCGSQEKSKLAETFAEALDKKFKEDEWLKNYLVRGDFNGLGFPATKSATINDARWMAYHIELPPGLRINADNGLPDKTSALVHCLANAIKEICV